jgi:hypothetical protein
MDQQTETTDETITCSKIKRTKITGMLIVIII